MHFCNSKHDYFNDIYTCFKNKREKIEKIRKKISPHNNIVVCFSYICCHSSTPYSVSRILCFFFNISFWFFFGFIPRPSSVESHFQYLCTFFFVLYLFIKSINYGTKKYKRTNHSSC